MIDFPEATRRKEENHHVNAKRKETLMKVDRESKELLESLISQCLISTIFPLGRPKVETSFELRGWGLVLLKEQANGFRCGNESKDPGDKDHGSIA